MARLGMTNRLTASDLAYVHHLLSQPQLGNKEQCLEQ